MSYSISPITGSTSRTATLTVAGNLFTITEAGLSVYTITSSAGEGGSISPLGQVSVSSGASQSFIITPKRGKKISEVMVDGVSQGPVASYTFFNVQDNHQISAVFSH